jgi:predicted CXXCH cytochrome family protein
VFGTRIAVALASGLLSAYAQSVPAADPPDEIDPEASCVTSECHGKVMDHPELHWQEFSKAGECQECHVMEEDEHEFELEDPPDLCTECHEEVGTKIAIERTVHDPAEDCTDCHDPHGGKVKALLLEVEDENLQGLCFECHDEDIVEEEYVHGPVSQGACNMCHDPHAASRDNLLHAEGLDLCGECHEDIAEAIEESEYIHDPAEDDCTDCHNPHSGPYPRMLFAEKHELCNECHDDIVEIAQDAPVDHEPVLSKDECLTCHSPHASNNPANLLEPQRDLCLSCHNESVESNGERLVNMQRWLEDNPEWHKPIVEDNCAGCHGPHGSENFRLLKEPFPETFYSPFKVSNYGLCFECHESRMVTVERTRRLTGFRDGDRNLHFLHVNKEKRGRTCRACHEVHASPHPLHIRDKVKYGKWMMPINYEKTETGASCHPGCHKRQTYDREATDATASR